MQPRIGRIPSLTDLRTDSLAHLSADVAVPNYDRSELRPSIVHIGVGGFHRAHLATYVDELARSGNRDWSIVGAGILPGDAKMAEALGLQDHLYTLVTRGQDTATVQVMGSIVDYVHAHPDRTALIDRIADPRTQIVSMTVTEGGYPIHDSNGEYNPDSTNAGADSAFGTIARGLDRRRLTHGQPVTVLSCDNVLSNGTIAQTSTRGEAAAISADLVQWIDENVTFPNSMVDRITPATNDADRKWLIDSHQIDDRWPVMAEPFRQWVVEDNFAGDRLPLEEMDVIVTDDVEPYEHMKLRLLNAGHSCLCYLAALDGIELVDEAMADPHLGRYERAFLEQEAQTVVPAVSGIDLNDYVDSLIERFANPKIGDQISRLCLDGSAKFPKFLIPTIEAQLSAGGPVALSALALAGWCQYLTGVDLHGNPINLSADPRLDEAVGHATRSQQNPNDFLNFDAVFASIGESPVFQDAFAAALTGLRDNGLKATIDSLC